jgi:hypothetical protein
MSENEGKEKLKGRQKKSAIADLPTPFKPDSETNLGIA